MLSLGGMAFEGPVPFADWVAARRAAGVFAICDPPGAGAGPLGGWRVLYVGGLDALAGTASLTGHPLYPRWVEEAGGAQRLFVAFHNMPSQDSRHREAIVRSLIAEYRPPANA